MRVAIVSDIHGNRQAFEAVLDAIEASECQEMWCLGDLVGYGADPDACVELARRHAAICLAGVAVIFATGSHPELLLWCLVGFIAFFAFSQGAVIWVYIAEVFPNRVRDKGQSLGSSSHWIMNAVISLIFPILAKSSGGTPFAFFAAMMVLQFFVVLFIYPETKGISLEQLQRKLGII